ncbi:MAG: alpha 1,2 mannosyltransferase [Watsoniomyces obsoletus]|nr:MAG: alpha 1,2 mannosyltransferase [Watsoniomyces obsoletus]
MWRRLYLLLVLVRLYFALSPSYLHPDENFQGPEVIAGRIFGYPVHRTWEFTSSHPIRSVYPLWPVYGLPMLLLHWVWAGAKEDHIVPPDVVFWTLRVLMFVLSFVLEDWAIHELVPSPRHRRWVMLLVASSYVTWTFQTHTFSNAVETLLVAWCLVLMQRLLDTKQQHSSILSSGAFAFLAVLGVFNRITFPAFLLVPGLRLIPFFWARPLSLLSAIVFGGLSMLLGVTLDTAFYASGPFYLSDVLRHPVITPLNNFIYNLDSKNLADHGLHPYYQHLLVNLPQLLGPAFLLLFFVRRLDVRFISAISGVFFLSLFRHQEARFLLPAIPLFLSSVHLPRRYLRQWVTAWVFFNSIMGVFMGVYHQGGIVPTQNHLAKQDGIKEVLWWRTYNPPTWLLDGKNEHMTTTVLMGLAEKDLIPRLQQATSCGGMGSQNSTLLVAPESSIFLDEFVQNDHQTPIHLRRIWHHRRHLNLDDLDFGTEGIWGSLKRVIGRRGLTTWEVLRRCD